MQKSIEGNDEDRINCSATGLNTLHAYKSAEVKKYEPRLEQDIALDGSKRNKLIYTLIVIAVLIIIFSVGFWFYKSLGVPKFDEKPATMQNVGDIIITSKHKVNKVIRFTNRIHII